MRTGLIRIAAVIAGLGLAGAAAGCGDSGKEAANATNSGAGNAPSSAVAPPIDPGDGGKYAPEIDPSSFVDVIDNPYMPWAVGSRWVYEGKSDGEVERDVVRVTGHHKMIMGIDAVVVRDTVSVRGEIAEDTYDWYAQDSEGNVWYLGEDSREYENGKAADTAGSWEAGVDGALPGIVMPADPRVGDAYRQEYLAGEAEDMMQVLELGTSKKVKAGSYHDVIVTEEWTPLEPDVVEQKYWARGVGNIGEVVITGGTGSADLVEYTPGP